MKTLTNYYSLKLGPRMGPPQEGVATSNFVTYFQSKVLGEQFQLLSLPHKPKRYYPFDQFDDLRVARSLQVRLSPLPHHLRLQIQQNLRKASPEAQSAGLRGVLLLDSSFLVYLYLCSFEDRSNLSPKEYTFPT
jgi:hypothetical protein